MSSTNRAMSVSAAVDAGAVVVLLAAALAGFWPAFGGAGFIRPAAIGLGLGMVIAWLGAWKRWSTILVGAATVVAYFLFGAVAALWKHAVGGVAPNLDVLKTLVFGSVGVWKQFVSASTPLGSFYGFMLVPFICALVGGAATATAAFRARHPAVALLPVVVLTVGVILLGTSQPFFPTVQAVVLGVVSAAWLVWRANAGHVGLSEESASATKRSQVLRAGVLLLAGALVAGGLGPVLYSQGLDREVIRRHVIPPLDVHAYASPLISFRDLVDTRADDVLFSVDGWTNKDYALRMAVMDTYDGMVYNVGQASGASRYDRVGPDLGDRGRSVTTGQEVDVTVNVDNYTGVWVPTVSQLEEVDFVGERAEALAESLYYNPVTDAAIDPAGLGSGITYTLKASVDSTQPTADTPVTQMSMPKPSWVPDKVSSLATQWAGTDKSALKRVEGIITTLQTTGYFSHGLESEEPSQPGHSSYRIAAFLDSPDRMVGDDEQYAVTAALMLLDVGIPARVVMGFKVDADSEYDGSTWSVKGSDVHAWVEVPFDGIGWVAFYPTPDKNQEPKEQDQRSKAKPKPQVLQPPPPANSSEEDTVQSAPDPRADKDKDEQQTPIDWGKIIRIALGVGIPLIVILTPLFVIAGLKSTRTKKRRKTEDLVGRVASGWQEFLDRAADLGLVVPQTATRRQASTALAHGREVQGMDELARMADQATFAKAPPSEAEAEAFWKGVDDASGSLTQGFSKRHRIGSKFSWTSLRRHPKPTIEIQETL